MSFQSINPATGELIREFAELSDSALEKSLEQAFTGWQDYRRTSFSWRAERLNCAADLLEKNSDTWGRLITSEMGKPLKAAVAEIDKCAWVCRFYADQAEQFLAQESINSDATESYVCHLPLGPVLAIMPWNFPFWQVFRFAAPALMAGNVGLLKHAGSVSGCAQAIETIFRDAGFPVGCFQSLLINSDKVADIIRDRRVSAVTLTGSEAAGRAVAAVAGDAIKPSVLELGGSDPFIVMPSANLENAVEAAVTGRMQNSGQSCIAAKRFIVHRDVYKDFTEQFVARISKLKTGDPLDGQTDIGPLATAKGRDDLAAQVKKSLAQGARRLTGAEVIDGPGFYYRPGVLAEIPDSAPTYCDEVFGPVAMLFQVESLDEAISVGNSTRFGLGSVIFTEDAAEIERAAVELEAGATFVNSVVASDPRLPFGGIKSSGYGRELGRDGILAFVNRKTVSRA